MRDLPVDLNEIAIGMAEDPTVGTWYLDAETGATFLFDEDLLDDEPEDDPPDWLDDRQASAWRQIQVGDPRREEIPRTEACASYRLMVRFAETTGDAVARIRLADALDGRGAFSRVRRVLADYPAERERWRALEDAAARQDAIDWPGSLGIRPIPRPRPETGS